MCRHLAYLGRPRTLQELVFDPPFGLARQAFAPRRQRHGLINADGFGVGWYVAGRPEPVRYRRAQPLWTDASFASLAPTIASSCVVASVRSATPGCAGDESCVAPFTNQRWLFAHNGRLHDWPQARKALWDRTLEIGEATAPVDSALLFGLAAGRWAAGAGLGAGLSSAIDDVAQLGGGRMNLLAADGARIAATRCGDTLVWRDLGDGVVIASEPDDQDGGAAGRDPGGDAGADGRSGWRDVPAGSLVEVDGSGVTVTTLDAAHRTAVRS